MPLSETCVPDRFRRRTVLASGRPRRALRPSSPTAVSANDRAVRCSAARPAHPARSACRIRLWWRVRAPVPAQDPGRTSQGQHARVGDVGAVQKQLLQLHELCAPPLAHANGRAHAVSTVHSAGRTPSSRAARRTGQDRSARVGHTRARQRQPGQCGRHARQGCHARVGDGDKAAEVESLQRQRCDTPRPPSRGRRSDEYYERNSPPRRQRRVAPCNSGKTGSNAISRSGNVTTCSVGMSAVGTADRCMRTKRP